METTLVQLDESGLGTVSFAPVFLGGTDANDVGGNGGGMFESGNMPVLAGAVVVTGTPNALVKLYLDWKL